MSNFKNANTKPALPYIDKVVGGWQVNYEPSRGWRMFPDEESAKADLVDYIDFRVAEMARAMFELTRLKRRILK